MDLLLAPPVCRGVFPKTKLFHLLGQVGQIASVCTSFSYPGVFQVFRLSDPAFSNLDKNLSQTFLKS